MITTKTADWQSKARTNKIFWSENALVVKTNNDIKKVSF